MSVVKSRSEKLLSRRLDRGSDRRQGDTLLVEEPLAIRMGETLVATTMRTPGHDFELAAGFVLAEGYVKPGDISGIAYCGTGSPVDSDFNVVSITSSAPVDVRPRLASISSACGACGAASIEDLYDDLQPLGSYDPWPSEILMGFSAAVRPLQTLFDVTGSSHAAAAIGRDGRVAVLREDIGRHNSVDKVAGRLLLDGAVPANEMALFVSGRASFEMVQKAWAAGFTALVSVSGPSTLAVATARRAGLTLMGFAREESATIYYP